MNIKEPHDESTILIDNSRKPNHDRFFLPSNEVHHTDFKFFRPELSEFARPRMSRSHHEQPLYENSMIKWVKMKRRFADRMQAKQELAQNYSNQPKKIIMNRDSGIARVETTIDASVQTVWHALTTPDIVKQYMFGADVISDFKQGGDIRWVGEWKGKRFEDRGKIVSVENNRLLQYSHFSPLSGEPDVPENYHLVTISLTERDGKTAVALEQDNNKSAESKLHAEQNWKAMLESLKDVVERKK